MLKGKRYFIRKGLGEDILEKILIIADVEDIVEKIELAGLVYVQKDEIDNIEEYKIEDICSNENAELEEMKEYLFMTIEDFTADEKYFLENEGYAYLAELEKYENIDLDILTSEEIEKLEEETETELTKSIIEKMKKEGEDAKILETYKVWGYYDGSNWREEILEIWYRDTEWIEITNELKGMKEIDYKKYNTGHKELFELVDGRKVLIDTSYYQGSLWSIIFLDADIETIEEAEKVI